MTKLTNKFFSFTYGYFTLPCPRPETRTAED